MLASRTLPSLGDPISFSLQSLNAASELAHDLRMRTNDKEHVWIASMMWIWNPTQRIEVRLRDGDQGWLLIADVAPTSSCDVLRLYLGMGHYGVDMCTLWQGEKCVMWNSSIGFCSIWPALPTAKDAEDFNMWVKPLIRRNCYLLGAPVEATPEEKRGWTVWMITQAHLAHGFHP